MTGLHYMANYVMAVQKINEANITLAKLATVQLKDEDEDHNETEVRAQLTHVRDCMWDALTAIKAVLDEEDD